MAVERGDTTAAVGGTSSDAPTTFEQTTLGGTTTTGNAKLVKRDATEIDVLDLNNYWSSTTVEGVLDEIGGITLAPNYWGNILGTLSNQTDLQTELDAKLNRDGSNTFTGTFDTTTGLFESSVASGNTGFDLSSTNTLLDTDPLLDLSNNTLPLFYVNGKGGAWIRSTMGIGPAAFPLDSTGLGIGHIVNGITSGLGAAQGISTALSINGTLTGVTSAYGISFSATSSVNANSNRFDLYAAFWQPINFASNNTGNGSEVVGGYYNVTNFGTSASDNLYGMLTKGSGKAAVKSVGIMIQTSGNAATPLTTGIYLEKQTLSTEVHGIMLADDGVGSDITYGAGTDVSTYFDGSNFIIDYDYQNSGATGISFTANGVVKVYIDINGQVSTAAAAPTAASHLTRKDYVDALVGVPMIVGKITGTGTVVTVSHPGTWSVSKIAVGQYRIVHPLGVSNLSMVCTAVGSHLNIIHGTPTTTTIDVFLRDLAGAATDGALSFHIGEI